MGCCDRLIVPRFMKEEIASTVANHRLLTMEIEFNSDCNFHCLYCYTNGSNSDPRPELGTDDFRAVIAQGRDLGVRTMVILGGEPMLYPHLFEMIAEIRQQGMHAELFTNGSNMTLENARRLLGFGVMVVLKMNTFDEKIQDMLSGRKGAYDQIHAALSNLKEAGYPGPGKRLGVSTIICQQNIEELPRLWSWLREQNITPYFEMITPQGGAKNRDSLYVDSIRVQALFSELSRIDQALGYDWKPQPPLVGMECLRHQYSCVVTSRGDVYPCVGVTIPVGNVKDRPLADIIRQSGVIKDLRNFRDTIKGPCRECEELDSCYGCRGAAYQMTGDYLASDPLCWKNQSKLASIPTLPAKVRDFVPHREPMLLVDRLLEFGEESVAEVRVEKDMIFVNEDGTVEDVALLEMIAQAVASHNGFKTAGNGTPLEGFLIGAKDITLHGTARVGDTLHVALRKVAELGELAVIRGEVRNNGHILAAGEVKVWKKSASAEAVESSQPA